MSSKEVVTQRAAGRHRRTLAVADGRIMGLPLLHIGMTLDIQNAGVRFSSLRGVYWEVTAVEQRYKPGGFMTYFTAEAVELVDLTTTEAGENGPSSQMTDAGVSTLEELPVRSMEGVWDDTAGTCPTFTPKGSLQFYHVGLAGLADNGTGKSDPTEVGKEAILVLLGGTLE